MTGDDVPRSFPSSVDVAIVGSGPTGAAYARVLSELSPGTTLAVFEVAAASPGVRIPGAMTPTGCAYGFVGMRSTSANGASEYSRASMRPLPNWSYASERIVHAFPDQP